MTINKSVTWGLASAVFLSLGLSGCMMDEQNVPQANNSSTVTVKPIKSEPKIVEKKSSAAREPIQQVAPGPQRDAAPQLPVIP